jgi:hypothetical protein
MSTSANKKNRENPRKKEIKKEKKKEKIPVLCSVLNH